MGKTTFCDLKDDTDKVQLFVKQDALGEEGFQLFRNSAPDLADERGFFRFYKNSETPIWTSRRDRTSVENAFKHWRDHFEDFPNLNNALEYVAEAQNFVNNPPSGTLVKVRANGDFVYYNPESDIFAIANKDKVPRTMYKPKPEIHGFPTNMDYFNAQK